MRMVFRSLTEQTLMIYLYEIIIINKDVPTHLKNFELGLKMLQQANLKMEL